MRALRSAPSAVVRWFDSWAPSSVPLDPATDRRVDWVRVLPFLLAHVACLGVLWVGWSPVAVGVAVALYLVRMFAITGFYHRYFSHRTFRTSRGWQFAFALLGATAVQRGPLWWAAHHRHHHRHADREQDIHSPVIDGFLWSHMLWITSRRWFRTRVKEVPDLVKFPELVFLDRFDVVVPVLFAGALWGLGAALGTWWPASGTSGAQMLVWGFFISTIALFHGTCTINSLAHRMGTRPYATPDDSRNSLLLAIVTLGEGWHNNHHRYPGATRNGFLWWEIDPTWWGLRTLAALGIIHDLHPVPDHVVAERTTP